MSEMSKSTNNKPLEPQSKKPRLANPVPDSIQKMQDLLKQTKRVIEKPIVWIDCEMTGLDVFNDHIIEICCIITDGNLNIVDEVGYESTVYQPKEVLDAMNEWCVDHHTKSGLVAKILSTPEQTLEKVHSELFDYISKLVPNSRTAIMAGNSIHMDKFFMMKEFPKVIEHLHYRLIDVSTIMEFGYRHNPDLMKCCPKKTKNHTARSDILESIEQLKWYQDHYLKSTKETEAFVKDYENNSLDKIIERASEVEKERSEADKVQPKRKA